MSFFSSGIADPAPTPARHPGSVRRTTHMDIWTADGTLHLSGACRDLRSDDTPTVLATAAVRASLAPGFLLETLEVDPPRPLELIGRTVRTGFRAAVDAELADQLGSALHVLLDELPVAALISGYALMYTGVVGQAQVTGHMEDLCSGWRADGKMIASIRESGRLPVPLGPEAPGPEPDDPWAWHELGDLETGHMRRRRLIDLDPDGTVFATFRDSHVGEDGVQRVLHEYTLRATLSDGVLHGVRATPQVLPWHECPHAAASAARLDGLGPDQVLAAMRGVRGIDTCTHLNDLLRSLAGLTAMTGELA